jgi:serine/threonine-protein kinase
MHPAPSDHEDELAALAAELEATPYRPIRRVADGGMARVYEVEHRGLRRRLAMKLSLEPGHRELDERLRIEAQALAQLRHPCLLEVSDFGHTAAGRAYVVSELLEGRTLAEELARCGALPVERAVSLVVQALEALGAAHRVGVVHRDVKLDNLFVSSGDRIKVLDFGIAKLLDPRGARLVQVDSLEAPTADGTVLGTPAFLAPEQVLGRVVDARADLYSMGVVLYALLCGRPPFQHADALETARAHAFEPPPPPSSFVHLGRALEAQVMRALDKRPEGRPPDAASMASALRDALLSDSAATPAARETPGDDRAREVLARASFPMASRAQAVRGGSDATLSSTEDGTVGLALRGPHDSKRTDDDSEGSEVSPIEDRSARARARRIELLALLIALSSAIAIALLLRRLLAIE